MNAPHQPGAGLREAVRRRGSLWQTVKAVSWSFFGVRRSVDHAEDVSKLNPVHVVVVGLVLAGLFVLGLVGLVNWVIGSGVAAGV
ncbi:MAG: DUF2970 domain-containing protein [Caldimonas sp.]|uniref:DUF2970 domain-containing protein n=1 Tax=Caldimonas sp. TaxID=2838790 RepID=UPI00391B6FE9